MFSGRVLPSHSLSVWGEKLLARMVSLGSANSFHCSFSVLFYLKYLRSITLYRHVCLKDLWSVISLFYERWCSGEILLLQFPPSLRSRQNGHETWALLASQRKKSSCKWKEAKTKQGWVSWSRLKCWRLERISDYNAAKSFKMLYILNGFALPL